MLINLFVAMSNLYGFTLFRDIQNLPIKLFFNFVVICSILMHLSETKHGLQGIEPFNIYSHFFLNLDRFVAIMATIYCIYRICFVIQSIDVQINIIFGLVSLYISENHIKMDFPFNGECIIYKYINYSSLNQILFALLHSFWHIQAYYILYKIGTDEGVYAHEIEK